jgi:hypothetical protein
MLPSHSGHGNAADVMALAPMRRLSQAGNNIARPASTRSFVQPVVFKDVL